MRYISFSGGVESTAMCVLYGAGATALFSDTGWEHQAMYDRLDLVEDKLKDIHEDFTMVRVKPRMSLPEYIRQWKFFPSPMKRFCTRYCKIYPIDAFLDDKQPCKLSIGLNRDERELRTGNKGVLRDVEYEYPLYDDGYSRDDCKAILKPLGLLPQFPAYMNRGGCKGCFFKSTKEFEAMALLSPNEADELADLEEEIQDKRKKHYGVQNRIKSMRKFIEAVRSQKLLFPLEVIYQTYEYEHTPCGVFCHR